MSDARTELSKEKRAELDRLATEIVRDSIVEKATSRLIAQIMAEVHAEQHRLSFVRATIYVNAKHMGCSDEEATAYADGTSDKPFIEAMIEWVKLRADTPLMQEPAYDD